MNHYGSGPGVGFRILKFFQFIFIYLRKSREIIFYKILRAPRHTVANFLIDSQFLERMKGVVADGKYGQHPLLHTYFMRPR
jgi:hypothetical protein